jgi:hypothetical protein
MMSPVPEWMQPQLTDQVYAEAHSTQSQPLQPHQTWPSTLVLKNSVYVALKKMLQDNQGRECRVVQYFYAYSTEAYRKWTFGQAATTTEELIETVKQMPPISHRKYKHKTTGTF